jgi:DNA-binding beta-propeller fold protein YncE
MKRLCILVIAAATAACENVPAETVEEQADEVRGSASCNPLPRDRALIEGTSLLVALESGGVVGLDPRSGWILHRWATGPDAFGAAFSEDGKRAFVTDKTGTFVEIDPESDRVLSTISIGATPQQLAVVGDRAYVTLSGEGAIAVIDLAGAPRLERKIQVGTGTKPHVLSISPDKATLFATVQGIDPKVISFPLTASGEGAMKEYRYDIVPRVVAASNQGAFFTGHHSTGLHRIGADGAISTPFMDVPGSFSEARKQIEGAWTNDDGSLVAYTHEGRKALVITGASAKVRDIAPLSSAPYWVTLDPSERAAYVSIPGSSSVEAYDLTSCSKRPLWRTNVGGKAKRMNVKACR